MNKEKIKEVRLPMKFNPGTKQYEPELPVINAGREVKPKIDWKWIIIVFVSIIVLGALGFLLSNH